MKDGECLALLLHHAGLARVGPLLNAVRCSATLGKLLLERLRSHGDIVVHSCVPVLLPSRLHRAELIVSGFDSLCHRLLLVLDLAAQVSLL